VRSSGSSRKPINGRLFNKQTRQSTALAHAPQTDRRRAANLYAPSATLCRALVYGEHKMSQCHESCLKKAQFSSTLKRTLQTIQMSEIVDRFRREGGGGPRVFLPPPLPRFFSFCLLFFFSLRNILRLYPPLPSLPPPHPRPPSSNSSPPPCPPPPAPPPPPPPPPRPSPPSLPRPPPPGRWGGRKSARPSSVYPEPSPPVQSLPLSTAASPAKSRALTKGSISVRHLGRAQRRDWTFGQIKI